tara:strand:- start:435 stop:617 length:183 start_codon:yes stop_codon:yes gene_type:complete
MTELEDVSNDALQTQRHTLLEDFDNLSKAKVTDEEYWRVWQLLNTQLTAVEQELRTRGIL